MKKALLTTAVALCCLGALVAAEAPVNGVLAPQPHYGKTAKRVAAMLPGYHVLSLPFDESMSRKAWTNLVSSYDYNRCVFLQEDLDRFTNMLPRIDRALKAGDVSFGYELHRLFVERLGECVDYATNLLASADFDFSVKEEYMFKRDKAAWPANRAEREEIWRLRIKNELLAQTLGRQLDAEEERDKAAGKTPKKSKTEEGDKDKTEEGDRKKEKSPIQNLTDRYSHYLKMILTEQDEESVLQRYLLATCMSYDPHSAYMAPMSKEDFDMEMNLSLCGVGAVLSQSMDDGSLEIKEVMKGGPIAREGSIKAGNKIVGVGQEDEPVEDITWKPMRKTIRKIRGPKNTRVTLEITDKSGASRRLVRLVRDEIKLEDQAATGRVETVVCPDGVTRRFGYVKLPGFYGTMDKKPGDPEYRSCSYDVAKYVSQFNSDGTDGMVLDLRGNGGGSLKEAVLLTALFVRDNPGPCPVVQIREKRQLYVLPTFPDQPNFAYRKPLLVLVDRHSASASEIVAGALQDTGRALVVGDTQTHGKGTVQSVLPMGGEKFGSMKVTTARFYRINGSSTQVKGVASDIVLPSAFDERSDVGEDKLPNALPWSRIEPASYEAIWNVGSHVLSLREESLKRRENSPEWANRMKLVAACKASSDRISVPLERDERLKMMREDRAVVEASEEDDEEDDEESGSSSRRKKMRSGNDIVLKETFNILGDLVRMTDGAEVPAASEGSTRKLPAWLRALER